MEPWLHLIPRTLTVRHLASPVVPVECHRDVPVGEVVARVQQSIQKSQKRATVLFDQDEDFARFAILDWCLSDPIWLEEWRDDPISVFEREASVETETDADTAFAVALERFVNLNVDDTRKGRKAASGVWKPVENDQHLLVFSNGSVYGAMRSEHFRTVPVRLAVFSYLLELEEAVMERASADPDAALACLSAERLSKARELAEKKGRSSLLAGTMFCDRLTIARKMGWCCKDEGSSASSLVSRMESVRNWCAHADADSPTVFLDDLLVSISTAREMVAGLA